MMIQTSDTCNNRLFSLNLIQFKMYFFIIDEFDWSWWTDSNPRPADYKSAALPTELHQHDYRHQMALMAIMRNIYAGGCIKA